MKSCLKIMFLLAVISVMACSKQTTSTYAPDFTLPDINGQHLSLSDLRGKPVILDFFSITCPVCAQLVPNLKSVYNRYRSKGLCILGIDLDNLPNTQPLVAFIKKEKIPYPILIGNEEIVMKYGNISVLPELVFVDKQGKIFKVIQGYVDEKTLENIVNNLFGES